MNGNDWTGRNTSKTELSQDEELYGIMARSVRSIGTTDRLNHSFAFVLVGGGGVNNDGWTAHFATRGLLNVCRTQASR